MNNETVTLDLDTRQEANNTESPFAANPLKRGIEIVPSAALSSRFFHGPSHRIRSSPTTIDEDWAKRVARATKQ
jgi:hypothetical protein